MAHERTDPAALLRDARWVRALSQRLVADSASADDLAQEAVVASLVAPPRAGAGGRDLDDAGPARRAWFARVLASLARRRGRDASSRAARERVVARREAVEDDVVARADASRRLVELVLDLDEPYRSTLLLRYFDGFAPHEIARRTGTSASTVRTRIERGLGHLRARIGRTDRAAWFGALASAVPVRRWEFAPLVQGVLMSTAAKFGLAAVGGLILLFVFTGGAEEPRPERGATTVASLRPASDESPSSSALAAPEDEARAAVDLAGSEAATAVASSPVAPGLPPDPGFLTGIVLRGEHPVSGGTLWHWAGHWRPIPPDPFELSASIDAPLDQGGLARVPIGSDGRFRAGPLAPGWYSLGVDVGAGIALQTYVEIDAQEPGRELVLVLGTARIVGRVHDVEARPVEGADVRVSRSDGEGGAPVEHHARTDAAGRYALESLAPAEWWISHDPAGRQGVEAEIAGMRALAPLAPGETRVVDFGPAAGATLWTGRVVAADGEPVPLGGRLGFTDPDGAYSEVPIDAEGRFRLRLAPGEHVLQATLMTTPAGEGTGYLPLGRHVAPSGDQELDLVVPGAVVRARVHGAQARGRAISLHLAGPDRRPQHAAEVGADGLARFLTVPPGRWHAVATPPHSVLGPAEVEVRPGDAVVDIEVVLHRP